MPFSSNFKETRYSSVDLRARDTPELRLFNAGICSLPNPEQESIGPLIRDYNVIYYCTAGHGTLQYNDQKYSVSPGQCFCILAGDVTAQIAAPGEAWECYYITLIGTQAVPLLNASGISPKTPLFPWDSNPEFFEFIRSICTHLKSFGSAPLSEFLLIAYAYLVFDKLQQLLPDCSLNAHSRRPREEYIHEAQRFMSMHCAEQITISDVAAHLGLNRSYFYSIFKQTTGVSPQEHLIHLRIMKACDLFSYPYSNVTNVANSVGLETSVFFRHFKRIVGESPSQYRRRILDARKKPKS